MAAQPQQAGIQSAARASQLKPRPFSTARRREEVGRAEESAGQCLPHMKDHFTCIGNKNTKEASAMRRPARREVSYRWCKSRGKAARQQGSTSEAGSNKVQVLHFKSFLLKKNGPVLSQRQQESEGSHHDYNRVFLSLRPFQKQADLEELKVSE